MTGAPRKAAVVLAIFSAPPHGVLFLERATHLRHHPGQIGLPGGGMDEADGGESRGTALREMHEEVGIAPERVQFVWTFADLHPRVSNYLVTPHVAVVAPGPIVIDPSETAAVFTVPLETVLADVRDSAMEYDGKRIWGLTGHILRMFVEEWNVPESAMRAEIERRLSG